LVRPLRARRGL